MGAWLLAGVALVYVTVALIYARQRRYGMALTFIGYGIANLGLIWDIWQWKERL